MEKETESTKQHKKILVTGVSGTGKSAVHKALKEQNVSTIGIDETPGLCSWTDKQGDRVKKDDMDFNEEFLRDHEWTADVSMLENMLSESKEPVFVCGSCDNIIACMQLCDVVLLLECSPEVFFARIDSREDNPYGKQDAAKQALLGYYKQYNQECRDAGAKPIDASQPLEKVVTKVLSYAQ